jgi:Skp family chaperone for outer membrane proteins
MNSVRTIRLRTSDRVAPRLALLGAALAVGFVSIGAAAWKKFRAPITTVVDISLVFDGYDKKKDLETTLAKQKEGVQGQLDRLKDEYTQLKTDLEQLEKGSAGYTQKILRKTEIELRILEIQDGDVKVLLEKQGAFLRELRDEIGAEIQAFAKANEIDLVVERRVIAEAEGGTVGIRWPIIHFAAPDLDITDAVLRQLNAKYAANPAR